MTAKYGRSIDGVELTETLVDELAEEAEVGDYDMDKLKAGVRRGRPRMGSAAADILPVRLDPELRRAVAARAEREGTNQSDVVRKALRQYLAS